MEILAFHICIILSNCARLFELLPEIRWYFDAGKGGCVQFTYGGCGGNANNFKTLAECNDACEVLTTGNEVDEGAEADVCQLEPDAGPCKAIKPRFFFDPESRTCLKFQGCHSMLSWAASSFITVRL